MDAMTVILGSSAFLNRGMRATLIKYTPEGLEVAFLNVSY
jgi:hypothetical protein